MTRVEARTADRERIAAMEKQLAAADADVAAFRVHFSYVRHAPFELSVFDYSKTWRAYRRKPEEGTA